jgi:hypothetical protein
LAQLSTADARYLKPMLQALLNTLDAPPHSIIDTD